MDLNELQSIRDRERQSDSLQQLRESFYEEVGEFIATLRAERQEAAARADDPFEAPEVSRLSDDIRTAEETVEAIYERRVGKVVKMASFAAADMPTQDEGLTAEERDLFENLVAAIESNRGHVLDGVVAGHAGGDGSPTPDAGTNPVEGAALDRQGHPADSASNPDAAPTGTDPAATTSEGGTAPEEDDGPGGATGPGQGTDGVGAADLMGGTGGNDDGSPGDRPVPPDEPERAPDPGGADADAPDGPATGKSGDAASTGSSTANTVPDSSSDRPDSTDEAPGPSKEHPESSDARSESPESAEAPRSDGGGSVDRTTVRITRDVGEIFGVDQREYELSREDVVVLPSANADPLVERDAAERLE